MWSSFFSTAGADCWELNSFGGQVVLVRTLKKMLSGGGVCFHGLCMRGLVMTRMLACLLWFHSKLLLFGADRLCTLDEKRMWLRLLEPEIRRGWTRKAKSAKVGLKTNFFKARLSLQRANYWKHHTRSYIGKVMETNVVKRCSQWWQCYLNS